MQLCRGWTPKSPLKINTINIDILHVYIITPQIILTYSLFFSFLAFAVITINTVLNVISIGSSLRSGRSVGPAGVRVRQPGGAGVQRQVVQGGAGDIQVPSQLRPASLRLPPAWGGDPPVPEQQHGPPADQPEPRHHWPLQVRGEHRGPGLQDGEQVRRPPGDRPPLRPPCDLPREQLQPGPAGPGRLGPALLQVRPVQTCCRPSLDHQWTRGEEINLAILFHLG